MPTVGGKQRRDELSVVSAVIDEIRQSCARRGKPVHDAVVAYVIKGAILNPSNGFDVKNLARADLDRLVEVGDDVRHFVFRPLMNALRAQFCTSSIVDGSKHRMQTIYMQVMMEESMQPRERVLQRNAGLIDKRLDGVVRDIVAVDTPTADSVDELFRKMIGYILLRTNLGSPTDLKVVEDCTGMQDRSKFRAAGVARERARIYRRQGQVTPPPR